MGIPARVIFRKRWRFRKDREQAFYGYGKLAEAECRTEQREKAVANLRLERIPEKNHPNFFARPSVKYQPIADHRTTSPIPKIGRVQQVSASGYSGGRKYTSRDREAEQNEHTVKTRI